MLGRPESSRWLFALLVLFLFPAPAAAENGVPEAGRDTFRRINANRALLAQAQAQYESLKTECGRNPTGLLKRELEKTEYKIKALSEDSSRLLADLPEKTKAEELVKYVLAAENARAKAVADTTPKKKELAARTPGADIDRHTRLHEQALELVSQNRYEEAVKVYEDILLLEPEDDQAFMILGHLYVLMGWFERAERAFYNAVEIDPSNVESITPFYENLVLKNPGDDNAYTNLGYVFLMFKNAKGAEGAFRDALSINPENTLARAGLEQITKLNR